MCRVVAPWVPTRSPHPRVACESLRRPQLLRWPCPRSPQSCGLSCRRAFEPALPCTASLRSPSEHRRPRFTLAVVDAGTPEDRRARRASTDTHVHRRFARAPRRVRTDVHSAGANALRSRSSRGWHDRCSVPTRCALSFRKSRRSWEHGIKSKRPWPVDRFCKACGVGVTAALLRAIPSSGASDCAWRAASALVPRDATQRDP